MADCTYIFHGRAPIVGIPALKAYLFEGGLEEQFPNTNSAGKPIADSLEGVLNFWKWFGKSKVIDAAGKPLVVYHGTGRNIGNKGEVISGDVTAFDPALSGKSSKTGAPEGTFFFTDQPDVASSYTVKYQGEWTTEYKEGANVMPLYLSISNPLKVNAKGENWREILYKGEFRDLNEIVQLAKDSGKYDGVIVSRVSDKGIGPVQSKTSTTYVTFAATQQKSATGNNGEFSKENPDIRFSRTENFNRWSENAPLVKMGERHEYTSGAPVVVEALHATTADFTKFDRSRANIESDMGGGFYFTNTRADAAANYAGKGPDLKNKIERDAERIAADEDISMSKARKIAEKQYMDHKGFTMPVYVRFVNPVVLGGKGETYFDYEENYDEETDSYDEPTGKLVGLVEALRSVAFDFNVPYLEDSIQKLWENFPDGGKASEIFESLSDMEAYSYEDDLATREVIRQALEEMGFDGVIDQTVNQKFGSERVRGQKMAGMKPGTIHFIAFKPNQVKSSLGNNGEYSRENDDIRYSKSETPAASEEQDIAQAVEQAVNEFGTGITTLHQNGILNFTHGYDNWPEGLKSMLTGREEAVYANGKIYMNLAVVPAARRPAVLRHELGEHFNLERVLGPKEYQALQNQMRYRAGIQGSQAEKVWNQVERLYPDLEVGSKEFISEVIAKLGEIAPNAPWYRRLLAKFKAYLVSKGFAKLVRGMSEADMYELLNTSVRSAAKGAEPRVTQSSLNEAPRFYSALRSAIRRAPEQAFANPEQLKAWINGNASKFDVKKDEIYWSGINEWLDLQTGKLARQDVVDFMDENGVKVEDVVLGNTAAPEYRANYVGDKRNDQYIYAVVNSKDEVISLEETFDGAVSKAAKLNGPESLDAKHNTDQLTLPGGTDYRELVVTIPTTDSFNQSDSTHFGDVGKGKQIAWIRHNTRVDADGNKVLFLEEVQSQRGQEGRKSGFAAPIDPSKWVATIVNGKPRGPAKYSVVNERGEIVNDWVSAFSPEEAIKKAVKLYTVGSVPAAPFVTDANNKATNAYITLLMKKAVSEAIDNGHGVVAWTTGDQQADRYDLSSHVAEISVEEERTYYPNNSREVVIDLTSGGQFKYKVNGDTGEILQSSAGRDQIGKNLADVVGKELSEKILATKERHTISGDGLRIGGGWTQAMYGDENGLNAQGKPSLILQAVREIARKFGGGISNVNLSGKQYELYQLDNGNWGVRSTDGKQHFPLSGRASEERAREELRALEQPSNPALIITPQMREKILNEGMPLFSRAPKPHSMLWNRWFGQSRMQRGGEPIKFYHGSDAEFTVFDKDKLGSSTTHTTATLGHFFSENPVESKKYGHNVREFYLSIQKPFITTSERLDAAIGKKDPAKFAADLKALGYDGIYIKDAKYAVAFDSHQAKLTSNASPSFAEDVRFSRPDVLTVLDEFTKDDDIFKHPVSDSKTIEDVMFEVAPAYDWVNVFKTGNETTSVFMSPSGKPINVTENGQHVWINVASLEPGDSGGEVYAAVGNFAHNNGLKFIDDPEGVSPYAVRRRPVHMLSLALRFGTTDFLDVSENFENRSRQLGLEPLEWREGDDNWNTLRLFARNVVDVYQALPQLKEVKYDFETGQYDVDGRVLPVGWARHYAASEDARSHSIGESTIRRAVFLQSLASTSSGEKSRILEQLGADGRVAGGVPVKGMFSRVEDFEQYRYNQDTPAWYAQVKNSLLKMSDVAKKQSLALLSSDHLIEIAKHQAPGLKAFGTITLTRGQKISDTRRHADRLVDAAAKLNPAIRKQFNRIVNDSTDSDVNVAMPWVGITANKDGTYTVHSQTKFAEYYKGQANQIAKFEKGFATLPTQEEANAFLDTLFGLEAKQRGNQNNPKITAENAARQTVHAKLYAQMQKLPPEAAKLYQDMHDLFAKIAKEKLDEIVRRIEVGIADGRVREDMIAHMRATFENNSIQWYYAPLTRFGRYWYYGVMKDDNGKPVEFREHFETKEQLADRIAVFKKFGGDVKGQGEMLENVTSLITSAAADSYTAKVQKIIGEHVIDDAAREALQDAVYQFHLSTLPDVSMRHAQQHRKGVKGAETDVMRSFASRTHHAASQLANMIYGEQLTNVLEDHKEMKKLWENPDYMLDAEAKLQAIDMLSEDWDTMAAAGYLEKLELHADADHALLEQARKLRDHLHGRKREVFDADGKPMGTTGLDADSAVAELARIRPRQEAIIKGSKLVTEEYKQLIGHIIDELELTKNAMLNTQSTSIDQLAMKISNLNFFGMLGFGLSSMIVNTLQVPNVAIPMAMGKFSTTKTLKAFSGSFGLFMKAIATQAKDADGNCSITESLLADKSPLAADRILALEKFKEEGTIDRTQTFDLVGVAEGGMDKAGALHAIAKKSGWMFHHGERLNREVTLDAAYTLARESGMDHEAAINYARDLNNRANLNYSSDVAARLFRGPVARITLQFKKYQQGMLYNWVKTFNDMVSGVKRENYANEEIYQSALADKKEAKRAFMALLFVQMSFAGALGLPLMGSLMAVYGLLGDDDEDKDLRKDLLLGLTPILGADQAMLVTNGFFDAYTPIPLSTRMGQADLFFRAPPGEMDGKEASMAYALQFLGPTGGSLVNAGSALSLFNDGQWEKGFERLIPKAAADVLKSIRYATEGVTNNKGYHVKDMNAMESFIAATGFGNSDLNKIYMEQSYAKGEYNAIQATRNDIVTELGWQLNKGDSLDTDKMDEWNEKHPEWPINLANIESSAKRIQTNVEAREEHGYVLNPKEEGLYDKYDFFGED